MRSEVAAISRIALVVIVVIIIVVAGGATYYAVSQQMTTSSPTTSSAMTTTSTTTSTSTNVTQALDQLYVQAKAEGALSIAAAPPSTVMQPLINDFEAAYPGIQVTYASPAGGTFGSILISQLNAHNVQYDLAISGDGASFSELATANAINSSVNWNSLGVPSAEQVANGTLDFYDNIFTWNYNTNLVQGSQIPTDYQQLFSSTWTGKIGEFITGNCLKGYATQNYTGAVALSTQLLNLKPLIYTKGATAISDLSSGQVALGCAPFGLVLQDMARGAPLNVSTVGPTEADVEQMAVTVGSPHPYAAILFAAWFYNSPQAQQTLYSTDYEGYLQSSCTGNLNPFMANVCKFHLNYVTVRTGAQVAAESKFQSYANSYFGVNSTG